MRKVRCYECSKNYDFDEDGFCPRCGAFNMPRSASAIGADGAVIRRDGINERNHKGSFVHAELHEENRERRGTALAQSVKRTVQYGAGKNLKMNPVTIVFWIVFGIIALNIISIFPLIML